MPRTRSLAWAELRIGLLAISAIVITAIVVFLLSGEGGFFWQRYALKARFPNVAGLKTGAPVRVAGVEVGSVKTIAFDGAQVEVRFELAKDMQPRVTDQSVAIIGSVSLLGEGSLDITASTSGAPLAPNSYIKTARTPGQLADVSEQANLGLIEATNLLKDVRAGKGTLGKLVTDEKLYAEVTSFVDAANAVATNLRNGRGTLGKLANDQAAYDALAASLENLRQMTSRISSGEGSLGKLLKDDAFATSLTSTTKNLDDITGKLNRGEGTAGKFLTDEALYKRIDALTARLDELTKKLSTGDGTAAQLINDRQLYDNLNKAATELNGLLSDVRKDPQKVLACESQYFLECTQRAPIGVLETRTMSRHESGGGTVLLAFLVGAISGAAVALLFAPASGDETRQYLADKARQGRERALAAAKEGRDAVRRHKDHLASAVERGREAYNKARHGEETA